MNLAVISVAALAIAVIVSCVTSINVGVLAMGMAWIVGVYIGHIPINTVIAGFPTSLFLTLTGVTLLFSLSQCNGTLDKLAHHAVRGKRGVVPIMFFGTRRLDRIDGPREYLDGRAPGPDGDEHRLSFGHPALSDVVGALLCYTFF